MFAILGWGGGVGKVRDTGGFFLFPHVAESM